MTEEERQAEIAVLQALRDTYLTPAEAILASRALVDDVADNPPSVTLTYGALLIETTDTALIELGRAALETQYNTELDALLDAAQAARLTPP